MINTLFRNDDISKKERKHYLKVFAMVTAVYSLCKLTVDNEREINKLKKELKELKSKGE